ncbi:MAG: RNA polymerase sigma factor [Niabella sp.]
MTDKKLISLIGLGNESAYNMLYNRYWKDLYTYVFVKVKDDDVTQDLLQEFWIKVWNDASFVLYNEEGSAKGFFCKFLNFRVLDYYRAVHHEVVSLDNENQNLLQQMGYSHILEDISLKDLNEVIQRAIDDLPKGIKNIARLRRAGHSVSETARLLSVSEKTVRNKYSLAMAKIRELLKSSITKILVTIYY